MSNASSYLLAVDPGKISGWAVFKMPNLLFAWGQIKPEKNVQWSQLWQKFQDIDGRWLIICEGQFIPDVPYAASRAKKLELFGKQQKSLKIASSAGSWEGVARYLGWEVLPRIHPLKWRRGIFGPQKCTANQAKKLAVEIVNKAHELELKSREHHVAEAICIGDYTRKALLMDIDLGRESE